MDCLDPVHLLDVVDEELGLNDLPIVLKLMPAASTAVRVLQTLPNLLPPADDMEVLEEVLGGVLLAPQNRVS